MSSTVTSKASTTKTTTGAAKKTTGKGVTGAAGKTTGGGGGGGVAGKQKRSPWDLKGRLQDMEVMMADERKFSSNTIGDLQTQVSALLSTKSVLYSQLKFYWMVDKRSKLSFSFKEPHQTKVSGGLAAHFPPIHVAKH